MNYLSLALLYLKKAEVNKKLRNSILILSILTIGYFFADTILFNGIKPVLIKDVGFRASFFAKKTTKDKATIVLVGGGDWGAYWGQELAKANYVSLSLPYHREKGLPALPEEIPLEYFEKAFRWLKNQPQVNPNKIIVMGASRNAELALILASYYPELVEGVIAYSPSSVSWSNTVLPFNSDLMKPSWTFENKPIPYIPMDKLQGGNQEMIETLNYWKQGLTDTVAVKKASIQVEKINGSILLFSGLDDNVWPSAMMSDQIEARLKNSSFKYEIQNIQYKNAGHLISGNPNHTQTNRQGEMWIDKTSYRFNYGGTTTGDQAAQKDASKRVLEFLSMLKETP